MKYKFLAVSLLVIFFFSTLSLKTIAQGKKEGQVNWADGYVSAIGEGTATPSGNKAKDQLRAVRAATILAQRALLETVKELKIDSQTKVQTKMVQDDVINTRIEGTIQGAEVVKQNVRWEGETPIATVRPDSPVAKFLERIPAGGIHHFSLQVDDVAGTVGDMQAKGVRVLGEGRLGRNVHGQPIAFVHPKDFLGALVELEPGH